MALEDYQIADDSGNTYFANASPSNNPSQVTLDLLEGADVAARIRDLGYEDEVGTTIFTKLVKDGKTKDEALEVLAQNAAVLAGDGEIKGTRLLDLPEVDPFGEDQGEFYDYQEGDTQYSDQQRSKIIDEMNSLVEFDEPTARTGFREQVAYEFGQPVLKTGVDPDYYDALANELENYRVERPTTVRQGRRFSDTATDARAERASSRRAVARMGDKDRSASNKRRKGYNDVKALIEAENLVRSGNYDASDRMTDAMYMRHMAPVAEQLTFDPLLQAASGGGDPYTYVDPYTQAPLSDPNFSDPSNTPDVAQALNAPVNPRSTIDWADANKPGLSEGGRMFGNFPQVDITGAGQLFGERYQRHIAPALGGRAVPSDIRSLSELQAAIDMGLDALQAKGAKLYNKELVTDPVSGKTSMKSSLAKEPGVDALLNKMRYTPAEKAQLANAMLQLEASVRKGAPSPKMQAYVQRATVAGPKDASQAKLIFQAPEAINPTEGYASVARINPGQQIDGQDIVTAFRGLEGADAQKPFIGQVEGEAPRIYRYNKTGETSMEGIERVMREKEEQNAINRVTDKKGNRKRNKWNLPMKPDPVDEEDLRQKVVKAALTQERANRDNRVRLEKERAIAPYRVRIGG